VTDVVQPDATTLLLMRVGQSGKNVAEASSVIVVTGQTSASALPTPPTAGGVVPEEVVLTEGSALLGANAGSSRALVYVGGDLHAWEGPTLRWAYRQNPMATLFTLDDAAEGKDWERVETGVKLADRALNMALGALHDVFGPIGQVSHARVSSLDFPFLVLLTMAFL
jgi:hypothetical protein